MCNKPCKTCPWRRSSKVGGEDIPRFDISLMRGLASTVPPRGSDEDGFYQIMACHGSSERNRKSCIGYVAAVGYSNIHVRLLASRGELDLPAIDAETKNIELYKDFYTMLDDYEAYHDRL